MALFERLVISANEHHTQIHLFVANVNVQHVLFCAARNANWSPRFTCLHRWICHNEVENHLDIYKRPLCVRYSKSQNKQKKQENLLTLWVYRVELICEHIDNIE